MNYAILDPFLFHNEGPPTEWIEVIGVLRALEASILDGPYWRLAQRHVVRKSMKDLGAAERQLVQLLLGRAVDPDLRPTRNATVEGFNELFSRVDDDDLRLALFDDFDRSTALPPDDGVVLIVRTDARIAHPTPWGREQLHEFRPWQVDVVTPAGTRSVPCLRRRRNVAADPTRRVDERLPFPSDGAVYPYCVPAAWSDPHLQLYRFTKKAESILDAQNRAWQRPSHGGAHHWDVQLDAKMEKKFGVPYLNVTDWPGEPGNDKAPGSRHHPGAAGALKGTGGWKC